MRILVVLLLLVSIAQAAPHRHKVSPKIRVWLASHFLRSVHAGDAAAKQAIAPVSIRFCAPPSRALIRRLQRGGVDFLPGKEGALHLGRFYPARVGARGLAALARCAAVEQVDLDALLQDAQPLDLTVIQELGAHHVWGSTTTAGLPITGQGVKIGSIDSGVDIFHPAFFRADGALYAWLDADSDGIFEPGTDAVDLDGDGEIDKGEILGYVEGKAWSLYTQQEILASDSGSFTPDRDWLYADANGNGKRDYGPKAGFTEATPGYGEPLFVAEDLDGDGKLDPEEKLRALKTSKVAANTFDDVERERGKDLIQIEIPTKASHGTASSGVMLAGQRGTSRWVGVAPDADLLMATTPTSTQKIPLSSLIIWLSQAKADLILHEYAPWTGEHLDGSSNHEQLMDQASKLGIVQVTPAGNLGGTDKHARQTVAAGSVVTFPVTVPLPGYYGTHYYMHLTLLWRDPGVDLELSLADPSGTSNTLLDDNASGSWWNKDGKTLLYNYRQDSSRGTAMMDVIIYASTGGKAAPIEAGSWVLTVKHPGTSGSVEVWAYVSDPLTSWSNLGIRFSKHSSQDGLICFPATADSAVTVAAYAGHVGAPYEVNITGDKTGDLRKYSGRGERIDGTAIMDIAAPDNPVVPINENVASFASLGAYRVFGGTSGAGPHVAGVAALIKQLNPTLDGEAVRKAIRNGALADAQVGSVPSKSWGHGKLRAYRSLFGKDPPANTAPAVTLSASEARVGEPVTITATVTDAEQKASELQLRWDEGYDGTWDVAYGAVKPLVRTFKKVGRVRLKAEVRDSGGLTGAAAILLKVLPAVQDLDGGASDGGDAGVDGGEPGDGDEGCGCRVGTRAPGDALLLFLLLLVGLRLWGGAGRRSAGS